ncbi:MAG TPA: hypothetical protein VGX23_35275 [Actinocrinis sp.]|nr:hypothetical protein [Actinocrinis sp.]
MTTPEASAPQGAGPARPSYAPPADAAPVWAEPQAGPSNPAQAGVAQWNAPGSAGGPLSAAQSGPAPAAAPAFPPPGWNAAAQPGTEPPPGPSVPPAAKPPRVRKPIGTGRILVGVGALVSIAIGAGVGAVIVHGKNQHNQQVTAQALAAAGTKPQPQTAGVRADGSHYGPLFAYLMPIPSGYVLGPGIADYGDNSYLTQSQIKSDFDGLLGGQPQSDLSSAKGSLADVTIKAVAVRTFANPSDSLVVEVELIQSDVQNAAKNTAAFEATISDADIFRVGPSVPGYSQAKCSLPPGLGSDTIDSMICLASSGDIEVRVNAYGNAPLDTDSITQLVAQQLGLLKTSQTIG